MEKGLSTEEKLKTLGNLIINSCTKEEIEMLVAALQHTISATKSN